MLVRVAELISPDFLILIQRKAWDYRDKHFVCQYVCLQTCVRLLKSVQQGGFSAFICKSQLMRALQMCLFAAQWVSVRIGAHPHPCVDDKALNGTGPSGVASVFWEAVALWPLALFVPFSCFSSAICSHLPSEKARSLLRHFISRNSKWTSCFRSLLFLYLLPVCCNVPLLQWISRKSSKDLL